MKILMCTSEATPLAKTGGLADVVHALSVQLAKSKNQVVIMMPYYQNIKEKKDIKVELVDRINVYLSWRTQECVIYKTLIDGVTYYLLDNKRYFDRTNLYGYDDDIERFAFLTLAIRKVMKVVNFKPDIVHCHDWHVGLLPTLIKEQNKNDVFYNKMKFIFTIHNPAFKGIFDPYLLGDYYSLDQEIYTNGNVRYNGMASSLKAAIIYSDKITTVSPTHAEELLSPDSGHDLQDVIKYRKDDFAGILNGIDYEEFDPEIDNKISFKYGKVDCQNGKKMNANELLRIMNLDKTEGPIYGIVSRLTWQKGIDLVLECARYVLDKGATFVVLGSGEYNYEQEFENLRKRYPNQMGIYIGYSDDLAHKIYAGCDFFLMPSLFEPCGIGQMIALKYGTLPLVRLTGGLKDTITPYDGKNKLVANGFGFYDYDKKPMIEITKQSLELFKDKDLLKQLRKNAMSEINDWKKSAQQYMNLYKLALKKK